MPIGEHKNICDCGGMLRCKDSRRSRDAGVLRRRVYACDDCGNRFTTHESVFVGRLEGVGAITESKITAMRARDRLREAFEQIMKEEFGDFKGTGPSIRWDNPRGDS